MGNYDTAQICINGHIITDSYNSSPSLRQDFCSECGAKTIITCQCCGQRINGDYNVSGVICLSGMNKAPNYCHKCGKPYPWTQLSLEATEELLAIEDSLSADELSYLHENMNSLLVDTPKSKLVATKFKLALGKISSTTASAIKDIIVDIASESVKKIILPD